MKAGWQEYRLNDVCDLITCGVAARPEYVDTGVPFLSAKNVKDGKIIWSGFNCVSEKTHAELTKNNKPLLGDILYTRVGSYGEAAVIEDEVEFSVFVSLTLIKPKKHLLNNHFLKHYLNSSSVKELAKRSISSSGVGNLNVGTVREFPIYFPALPEQQRIVGIIEEAFDSIVTAKANAEKNLQNARAIFDSHLQSVFTQRGEGWVDKTIAEVCTLKSGTSVSVKLEKTSGDLPYIKVADMNHDGNEIEILSSSRFLNEKDIGRNAVFPSGTTIFPKRGGSILTNKKRLTAVPICADLNVMGVIPEKCLLPNFLYFYFLNVDMRQIGSGSSIPQINNYDIEPLVISFPESTKQQAEIVQEFEELSVETKHLESIYQQKVVALDALKKSLLDQAFTGQL